MGGNAGRREGREEGGRRSRAEVPHSRGPAPCPTREGPLGAEGERARGGRAPGAWRPGRRAGSPGAQGRSARARGSCPGGERDPLRPPPPPPAPAPSPPTHARPRLPPCPPRQSPALGCGQSVRHARVPALLRHVSPLSGARGPRQARGACGSRWSGSGGRAGYRVPPAGAPRPPRAALRILPL